MDPKGRETMGRKQHILALLRRHRFEHRQRQVRARRGWWSYGWQYRRTVGTGPGNAGEHPLTSTVNRAAGDVATFSQDVERQMQGLATAAQQIQGAETSPKADRFKVAE